MGRHFLRLAAAVGAVAAATFVYTHVIPVTNGTIVALTFLLIVLVVAATSALWTAVATSVAAMAAFNFFFLPPVGTLSIADPQNWVALFTFLAVSLVASNLSSRVRAREQEALDRRDELARLFDLSRDVLLMTESREAIAGLAGVIARRFGLDYVAVCLPRGAEWDVFESGPHRLALDPRSFRRRSRMPSGRPMSGRRRVRAPVTAPSRCRAGPRSSCRSGSARRRLACSLPPGVPSRRARWTRSAAWRQSLSSGLSCSKRETQPSCPDGARS
jgi:hypothetical protein